MRAQTIGLILGGLVPALCFSVAGVLQKAGARTGISPGAYLCAIGGAVAAVGILIWLSIDGRSAPPLRGITAAACLGVVWCTGMACIVLAISRFGAPVSKLVPLYNMNTLLTVLLGFWVFGEWKNVNVASLLTGALLIIIGGVLVTRA